MNATNGSRRPFAVCDSECAPPRATISFVIPVFNGAENVGAVVERIGCLCAELNHEIVLVDDGSTDQSREVCFALARQYPESICVLELARNFGEHNAVMAGLHETSGRHVVVLDDDGQNSPDEAMRMWAHARENHLDVVYARYGDYRQSLFRRACSGFNDFTARLLLGKPRGLYLSSFKVMSRFVVDEITRFSGPSPYLEALILRTTQNIGELEVAHRQRLSGRSGYTLSRLAALWLNTALGYSSVPLRLMMAMGLLLMLLGSIALGVLYGGAHASVLPSVAAVLAIGVGLQLGALGVVGEYVFRLLSQLNGHPQFLVRRRIHAVERRATRASFAARAVSNGVAP